MAIRSIADVRASWGANWADASDEEVLGAYSKAAKMDLPQAADLLGYDPGKGSLSGNRWSSSIDNYQSNLYGLGSEVAGALGMDGVSGWMGSRKRDNRVQADVASGRAQALGGIDSYKDVDWLSPSSIGNYGAGLAIQSAPYLAEMALPGAAVRYASKGLQGAAMAGRVAGAAPELVAAGNAAEKALTTRSVMAGSAAAYPSSVGDILRNQEEQNPDAPRDLLSAAIGGVPYVAANSLFGVGHLASTGRLAKSGIQALDNLKGFSGGLARTGASFLRTGVEEGLGETAQEGINQYFGRMAVDPKARMDDPDAIERYKESFVGGGLLGGMVGTVGGHRRVNPIKDDSTRSLLTGEDVPPLTQAPGDTQAPAGELAELTPEQVVEQQKAADEKLQAEQRRALQVAAEEAFRAKAQAVSDWLYTEDEVKGKPAPIPAQLVTAFTKLTDLGADPEVLDDFRGQLRYSMSTEGPKALKSFAQTINQFVDKTQKEQENAAKAAEKAAEKAKKDAEKTAEKAKKDAEKAAAEDAKPAAQKAEDKAVTEQAIQTNAATAAAAAPAPITPTAPAPIPAVNTVAEAAQVLLSDAPVANPADQVRLVNDDGTSTAVGNLPASKPAPAANPWDGTVPSSVLAQKQTTVTPSTTGTSQQTNATQATATAPNTGAAVTGPAPATNTGATPAPGTTGTATTTATATASAPVVANQPEQTATVAEKPLELGPQKDGKKVTAVVVPIAGRMVSIKQKHYGRIKAVLGLDDEGHMTQPRQTYEQVAQAEGLKGKNARSTILKSLQLFIPPKDGKTTEQRLTEITANAAAIESRGLAPTATTESALVDAVQGTEFNIQEDATPTTSDDSAYTAEEFMEGVAEDKNTGMRFANSMGDIENQTGMDQFENARVDAYKGAGSAEKNAAEKAKADALVKDAPVVELPIYTPEEQSALVARNIAVVSENERAGLTEDTPVAPVVNARDIARQNDARDHWNANLDDGDIAYEDMSPQVKAKFHEVYDAWDNPNPTLSDRQFREERNELYEQARADGPYRNQVQSDVRSAPSAPLQPSASNSAGRTVQTGEVSAVAGGSNQNTAPSGQVGSGQSATQVKPKFQRAPKAVASVAASAAPATAVQQVTTPPTDGPVSVELVNEKGGRIPIKDAHAAVNRIRGEINMLHSLIKCITS